MMTPSRIKSAAGASEYYAQDDYYTHGEAGAPGLVWGGKGAEDLGLTGLVDKDDLQAILEGRNPDPNGPALTQSENKEKHHPGWDFTFAVPKSVTLLVIAAERSDPELAGRLREHIWNANATAMGYLEENHAVTRVREEDGKVREILTGNLVYGSVMHITTRGGDPHIHVHNPIANTTKNPETGEYGALETRHMYKWQKNTSLVAARELQAAIMKEGFDIERTGEMAWEVVAVDKRLVTEFSSRSTEIDAASKALADERGLDKVSDAQRTMIQKQTRKAKEDVDRLALSDEWHGRAEAIQSGLLQEGLAARVQRMGMDITSTIEGKVNVAAAELRATFRRMTGADVITHHYNIVGSDPDRSSAEALAFGVRVTEAREAVNSKHLVMQKALQRSEAGLTYDRLEGSFNLMVDQGLLAHADDKMIAGLTTSRTVAREREILAAVNAGRGQGPAFLTEKEVAEAFAPDALKTRMKDEAFALTPTQSQGVAQFFGTTDKYAGWQGSAGVGKSTAYGILNAVAQDHDIKVRGVGVYHTVVNDLKGMGIEAQTLESFLREKERLIRSKDPAAIGAERTKWARTYLLVDEASQVTNDLALRTVRVVEALQIPAVRIAGDKMQLGGQGAGNPFKLLLENKIDHVIMNDIVRQRPAAEHLQASVKHMAAGRVKEGMAAIAPNVVELGKESTDLDVADAIVGGWQSKRAGAPVIVVATNNMRDLVSRGVREQLRTEGQIKGSDVKLERYYQKYLTSAEQFTTRSYSLGDVIVPVSAFSGMTTPQSAIGRVIGIDHGNNELRVKDGKGERVIDLTDAHERRNAGFSAFTARKIDVAVGDRLVWEARFKDRGYERGAGFKVTAMDKTHWTIEHDAHKGQEPRVEKIPAKDGALSYAGYGYAMTADRAQGKTLKTVIFELTTRAGEAANAARQYVMESRLTHDAVMVTDDLAKLTNLLLAQDGHKLFALDHLRKALDEAKAKDATDKGPKGTEPEKTLEKDIGMGGPGRTEQERAKPKTKAPDISRPTDMGGLQL
jgi:conjugative relaxase-like TrwC/TraI family protein